jgi:hypothetical protein
VEEESASKVNRAAKRMEYLQLIGKETSLLRVVVQSPSTSMSFKRTARKGILHHMSETIRTGNWQLQAFLF